MITLGLDRALREEVREIKYSDGVVNGFVAPPSTTGVSVSPATANTVAAYWNGVCVIAGDLGTLDRHLYRRVGEDEDRERATTHPAYRIIHDQPNTQTTAVMFWQTIASHAVSWGNGYAEIEWDGAMRPIGLWIITPDLMEPRVETFQDKRGRTTSRIYYLYRGTTRLEAEDVVHIAGLGFDGVRGYSPAYLARQSLGLSIAAERFGGAFFGNGAWPGLALEHPKRLSDPAHERLKASVNDGHQGAERGHRLIVLEEGMKVSRPITIPPDDAQFLETRAFQIEEIARWLNLPPHKLKHKVNERPGGNFEASELDYQVTTLLPWTTRIEQECDRKLIAPSQRATYYTEHNFAKRLKTDTATRMKSYETLSKLGAMDADQIARKENLPKPKAKAPVAVPAPPATDATPPEPAPTRAGRLVAAQRAQLAAVVARFVRRESENAKRAAARGMPGFGRWVETYYSTGEAAVLRESLVIPLDLCMAAVGSGGDARAVAAGFADRYLQRSMEELLAPRTHEIAAAVPALLKRWEDTRAAESAEELMAALDAAEETEHVA